MRGHTSTTTNPICCPALGFLSAATVILHLSFQGIPLPLVRLSAFPWQLYRKLRAEKNIPICVNMPRPCTKSVKEQNTHKYCIYCKANCDKRGFDKHQATCKIIWQLHTRRQESQDRPQSSKATEHVTEAQIGADSPIPVECEVSFHCVGVHCQCTTESLVQGWTPSRWQ